MGLDILGIGSSAVNAFQLGASVSAKNIANSGDVNYSREMTEYGQLVGGGIRVSIRRISDDFANSRLYLSQSELSETSAESSLKSSVDKFITGLNASDEGGPYNSLSRNIQSFFDSVQQLSTDVSPSSRQDLINKAQTLTSTMNKVADFLQTTKSDADSRLDESISQINNLTDQIAKLNDQIEQSNDFGGDHNLLKDQRDKLLHQLSEHVGIKTISENGQVSVQLKSGLLLVDKDLSYSMSLQKDAFNQKNEIKLDGGVLSSPEKLAGSLAGLLKVTNQFIPQAEAKLGRFSATITNRYNEQNKQGYVSAGVSGGDIFQALSFGGIKNTKNTGTGSITGSFDSENISGLTEDSYQVKVLSSGDLEVENLTTAQKSIYASMPISLNGMTLTSTGTLNAGDSFLLKPVSQAAQNMQVVANPQDIASSDQADGTGVGNLIKFAELENKKVFDGGKYSFTDNLSTTFSFIGGQAEKIKSQQESAKASFNQANSDKESISGVNIQEEYTDLIHFQQAYSAASKIISTDVKMFNDLLNTL